jgi:hypothetical protein
VEVTEVEVTEVEMVGDEREWLCCGPLYGRGSVGVYGRDWQYGNITFLFLCHW